MTVTTHVPPRAPRIALAVAALVALGVVSHLVRPAAAPATAPGQNGVIAFRQFLDAKRTRGAIFVVAPDGSGLRQVTRPPAKTGDDFPDVSADGRFVTFQRCALTCGVWIVGTDGAGLRRVDRGCHGGQFPPRCVDASGPSFSPDGTHIAYTRSFGALERGELAHSSVSTMRLDGTGVHRVSLPPTRSAEDVEPQWSPDGRQIVFVRHDITLRPRGQQAVFVVNADGTGLHRITAYKIKAGDGPDWSPDGTQILFRSPQTDDFSHTDLWTIHPDGTGLRQVTHHAAGVKVYSASFSPDGTQITFAMTGTGGNPDVFRIGVDGAGLTPVTRAPTYDSAPDWGGTGA